MPTSCCCRTWPVNSDVSRDDLLVSSGLGGVFPAGYPVGRITGVHREANQLLAQVRAAPQARRRPRARGDAGRVRAGQPGGAAHAGARLASGGKPGGRRSRHREYRGRRAASHVISRESLPAILLTSVVALVLNILPLPGWLPVIRPAFLVLAVLYWSTMAPFVAGMALGFFGGLALDVFQGSLLGEHALALSFLTYLALRLNLLTRAKPIFEQSLYVLVALLAYELLLWLIDGWTGPLALEPAALGAHHDRRPDLAARGRHARPLPHARADGGGARQPQMRIKDHWNEQRIFGSRTFAAILIIGLLSLTLLGKLLYLQVIRHDYYFELSQGNRVRHEPIPASRGLILDRRGQVLVDNEPAYQLELIPEQTPDLPDTLQRLAELKLLDPGRHRAAAAHHPLTPRLRQRAHQAAAVRRGDRPLRRASLRVPGRGAARAPDPPLPVRRARRARARLRGGRQRGGPRPHRQAGLRRHHADRQARRREPPTRRSCTASTATSKSWSMRRGARSNSRAPTSPSCRPRRRWPAPTWCCRSTCRRSRRPRARSAITAARSWRSIPPTATCSRSSATRTSIRRCSGAASRAPSTPR